MRASRAAADADDCAGHADTADTAADEPGSPVEPPAEPPVQPAGLPRAAALPARDDADTPAASPDVTASPHPARPGPSPGQRRARGRLPRARRPPYHRTAPRHRPARRDRPAARRRTPQARRG